MAISNTPVQSKAAATTSSTTTLTLTLDGAPTAGNVLYVFVCCLSATTPGAGCIVSCTNVTFTQASPSAQGASSTSGTLFIGRVRASAGTAITVTTASSGGISACATEFSGVSLAFDKFSNSTGTSTSPSSGTSASSATNNQLWIAGLGARVSGGTTFSSPTNSFAIAAQAASTGSTTSDRSAAILYRVVSTTGTMTAGATIGTSGVWVGQVIGFEEAPITGTITRTRATIGL